MSNEKLGLGTELDRRSMLKKSAVAAGVTAWATPTVLAATSKAAGAQFTTNCFPNLTVGLLAAESNCSNFGLPPSCCEKSTYGLVILSNASDCGAGCGLDSGPNPGPGDDITVAVQVDSCTLNGVPTGADSCPQPGNNQNIDCGGFLIDLQNCTGGPQILLVGVVIGLECEDGSIWECDYTIEFDVTGCPGVTAPPGIPGDIQNPGNCTCLAGPCP